MSKALAAAAPVTSTPTPTPSPAPPTVPTPTPTVPPTVPLTPSPTPPPVGPNAAGYPGRTEPTLQEAWAERERLAEQQGKWADKRAVGAPPHGQSLVGATVHYHTGPAEVNHPHGTVLAAVVVKVLPEPRRVNLQVFMPVGCGCFRKEDVPMGDGEPLAGSWSHRE